METGVGAAGHIGVGRASELARSVPTVCPFSGLSFKVCLGTLAPGYYLVTAYNNPGQWTLDARYWTVKWPGAGAGAELGYQWQAKYRWRPEFQFGLQGFRRTRSLARLVAAPEPVAPGRAGAVWQPAVGRRAAVAVPGGLPPGLGQRPQREHVFAAPAPGVLTAR